jgi:prolipoprotein diacylglyceryl transferase
MTTISFVLAAIPAPPGEGIHLGPLEIRAYGLAIAVGVITAVTVAQRRWAARGGNPDDIAKLATWSVIAGLAGARLYHVLTDYQRFQGRWLDVLAVWKGGLGIPGGLVAGVVTGVVLARRRGLPAARLLDVVAPAIPIAQAIGRLGNWFNQELFGRPTTLPWGLHVDPDQRPDGYEHFTTFHPTFLYEAAWNLALAALLIAYERRRPNAAPGRLFAMYVGGYALGRLWIEALRIDPASEILGLRVNIWTSLVALAAAAAWIVRHPNGSTSRGSASDDATPPPASTAPRPAER